MDEQIVFKKDLKINEFWTIKWLIEDSRLNISQQWEYFDFTIYMKWKLHPSLSLYFMFKVLGKQQVLV